MKKLIVFAIAILGFTTVSFGQLTNTASANATANVLTALTIEKANDLGFGSIGSKTAATIAVMTTAGARTGSTVDLIATSVGAAATFTVKGDENSPFSVTFPSGPTLLTDGVKPAMTILAADWKAKIDGAGDSNSGVIAAGGTTTLKVGATLQVGASQTKGDYTGTFSITVNYN